MELKLDFVETDRTRNASVPVDSLVIAGWTGRDADAIAHHIAELQAIGIPPPSRVPLFYRVAASLPTQAASIQVVGTGSSGEIEPVLLRAFDSWWLTIGSDHTDREAERHGIAMSKQACPKPIGTTAWRFDEIAARLDDFNLHSLIGEDGATEPYQRGTLAGIRSLPGLIEDMHRETALPVCDGLLMFCGTLPAIGPIRGASRFRGVLHDPRLGRSLTLDYRIETLALVS